MDFHPSKPTQAKYCYFNLMEFYNQALNLLFEFLHLLMFFKTNSYCKCINMAIKYPNQTKENNHYLTKSVIKAVTMLGMTQ